MIETDMRKNLSAIDNGDPLFLHNSDHTGMSLVTAPLVRKIFFAWSISIKIALGAEMKLGFINGSYKMSERDSPTYEQWSRVNFIWVIDRVLCLHIVV